MEDDTNVRWAIFLKCHFKLFLVNQKTSVVYNKNKFYYIMHTMNILIIIPWIKCFK